MTDVSSEWKCHNCGYEWENQSARRDYADGAKCAMCWEDYL